MTPADLESARFALEAVRGAAQRLDESRAPRDNARDLTDAWTGARAAVGTLIGATTLSDNSLIREARGRDLIELEDAHALLEFSAAAQRAADKGYEPDAKDIQAARHGFEVLADALHREPAASPSPRPAPAPPATATPAASGVSSVAQAEPQLPAPGSISTTASNWLAPAMVIVTLCVVIGGAGYYAYRYMRHGGHLERGIAAYSRGDRQTAKSEFLAAGNDDPRAALPHVYLGRIAREEGDEATAGRELDSAITLQPENELALREMGAHLLATGNADLARRFYVRALTRDPADRIAQGYLACALAKLGRTDEAKRWADRAGEGDWSVCVNASPSSRSP